MRPVLLSLAICLVLFACKKHASDIDLFWQCDSPKNLDSAGISNELIGSWKWSKRLLPTGKIIVADENIKVTFNPGGTFKIFENSSIITQGAWKLKGGYSNQWQLELAAPNEYLDGMIEFCSNKVRFVNSYVDGYDNLFEKEE